MICTSIANRDFHGVMEALEHCEMAEVRLDLCRMSQDEIAECFSSDVPLVATCRVSEVMASDPSLNTIAAAAVCEKRLVAAVEAGAAFVDVEIEAPKQMSRRVRQAAHENGAVFMRSFHDFAGTGQREELLAMVEKCRYHGADMVKLVTMASCPEDAGRVMSLYGDVDFPLVAFCMGDAGHESRLECLRRGAPFTYAALSEDEATAPGQWTADDMKKAVYGNFRFLGTGVENCPDGNMESLRMPCSKSFAQRAIIAAALASGESRLHGYVPCADSEAALAVADALGAKVEVIPDVYGRLSENDDASDEKCVVIKGIGASPECLDISSLHVGESGLLTRMMMPVAAQVAKGNVRFTGERTLLDRPMGGVRQMLEAFGVGVEQLAEDNVTRMPGGEAECRVPLEVTGHLRAGKAEISGKNGSQLVSGLLMALPLAERNSMVIVSGPKSIPYMFITLDVMKKFGVKVNNEMSGDREFFESGGDWSLCSEISFRIKGGQRYRSADFTLEGDWSAAAAFLVAGAVFGKVWLRGLDTTSLQADLTIMDVLMDAGASLAQLDGDRGVVTVQRAPLRSFSVDASHCPDLFPMLSVLAAFCGGTSRIGGVDRLAHKESDRGQAILQMLDRMGVAARIEENDLVIEGMPLPGRILEGRLLKGGEYTSHHDHRMVMALKVASLGADSPIIIDDEACVAKSFPQFLEMFDRVRM